MRGASFIRFCRTNVGRSVLSNFSWMFCLKIAGYLFPLLTVPYLARVIGADGFGKIAFASVVTVWVAAVSDWGLPITAVRDLARCKEDQKQVCSLYSTVFFIRILLFLACVAVVVLLLPFVDHVRNESVLLFFSLSTVLGRILLSEWFFQAMEDMKFVTIFNVIVKTVFTGLVFVFIRTPEDYILHPLLLSCSTMLLGVVSQILICVKWHVVVHRVSFPTMIRTVKRNTGVFLSVFMHNFYDGFSQFLLGIWGGFGQVGIYDAGKKLYELAYQFIALLSNAFLPVLSKDVKIHKFYSHLTMWVTCTVSLLLFVAAPWMVDLFFSSEFSSATLILRILSVSLPFWMMVNVYGTNYLIVVGEEQRYGRIITSVSLFGAALALGLVKWRHAVGVAMLILIVRMVMAISCYYSAKRHKHLVA